MNHKVHLCIRGCLTLKFSGSWNTVISALPLSFVFSALEVAPSGEMGIVDRSTCVVGSVAPFVSTAAEAMFANMQLRIEYGDLVCRDSMRSRNYSCSRGCDEEILDNGVSAKETLVVIHCSRCRRLLQAKTTKGNEENKGLCVRGCIGMCEIVA